MLVNDAVLRDKIQGLAYIQSSKQLISASDDCILGMWDMDVKRVEVTNTVLHLCQSVQCVCVSECVSTCVHYSLCREKIHRPVLTFKHSLFYIGI